MAANGEKPTAVDTDRGRDGSAAAGRDVRHDEPGITSLCDALKCFEVELVAIERGDGVLVERLLEAGHTGARCNPGELAPVSGLDRNPETDRPPALIDPRERTTHWSATRDRMDDWNLHPRRNAASETAPNNKRPLEQTKLDTRVSPSWMTQDVFCRS